MWVIVIGCKRASHCSLVGFQTSNHYSSFEQAATDTAEFQQHQEHMLHTYGPLMESTRHTYTVVEVEVTP